LAYPLIVTDDGGATKTKMNTIQFSTLASDLLPMLRAEIPANHIVVATFGGHSATGATKAEAANSAIALWSKAEGQKLAAAAWEANRETIYAKN